jgi:hypothetical protein
VDEYRAELLATVRRRPPDRVLIIEGDGNTVLPRSSRQYLEAFPALDRFVSSGYVEEARIGDAATVLRRRER